MGKEYLIPLEFSTRRVKENCLNCGAAMERLAPNDGLWAVNDSSFDLFAAMGGQTVHEY